MKSDKLKLFIRKIVREEVAMAIHEVINEIKQPVINKKTKIREPQKSSIENKTSFSKNTILNNILNETAQGNTSLEVGSNFIDEPQIQLNKETGTNIPDFLNKNYSDVVKKSYTKKNKKIGTM